ncbi:LuxR family transcriptional regulator [Actinomycetospora sp. NBRC 106378]|uniref:LuxR family transcriptional regulator n=1 Tax=Actinomycetospora sp. NBRC 106378 TaxID=3032208 RepID=UPI0024A56ED7|nr:LuxR family transcriptional regulator [Actinomycetospora sp. NBRC 106378]GLZ53546.1 transcriptional regulator [Actinomycetospora sp. NBRC 106378]
MSDAPLVGRQPELRLLGELVVDVSDGGGPRAGTGSALAFVGDVGVGKTALLDAAATTASAAGVRVVRADGWQGEADIRWAALSQVLGAFDDDDDEDGDGGIAAPPSGAEQVAFAAVFDPLRPAAAPAAVSFGVLRFLLRVGRRRPVLLLVDDTDRLDHESLRALLFVARRLRRRDRVAVLFAGRGVHRPLPPDAALPTRVLGPLDPVAAASLLDGVAPGLDPRVRREIVAAAAGNPLALREFATAGTARPRHLSAAAEDLFVRPLRELGPPTSHLLLAAAAAEGESAAVIARAAGASSGLDDWAAAERAGLVTVADDVHFRHPLGRAAAYASATAEARRRAHLALAAAGSDPDLATWQRAHACTGADVAVAAALGDTAERAEAAGDFDAAVRAWERAAECSPDAARAVGRRHRALQAAYAGGDVDGVAEQHRRLTELTDDPTTLTWAALLHAGARMLRGRPRDAMRALQEVAPFVGEVDDAGATLLAGFHTIGADFSGLPEHQEATAALLRHPAVPGALRRVQETADAPADLLWARAVLGTDRTRAAAALRLALEAGRAGPGATANDLQNLGLLADRADDVRRGVELLMRAHVRMHHEGPAAFGVAVLANLLVEHGRWTEADAVLDRWVPLADARGFHRVAVELASPRALLLALRGDAAGAHEVLAAARTRVDLADHLILDLRLRLAGSVAATVAGDPTRALRLLRGAFTPGGEPRHPVVSARMVALLAAAATDPAERADAALVVERVRATTTARGSARMRMLLHHADALLGPEHESEHHFKLALADPTGDDWPVERATTRLHHGEWLRRRRRGREAREMLAAALESFETLGAVALAERVRTELRAAGSAEHRDTAPGQDLLAELTPQQREVVRLAAEGLRNREIGQRLFLSPRTVGSHLHHAYPKLGISGRHQLAALFRPT